MSTATATQAAKVNDLPPPPYPPPLPIELFTYSDNDKPANGSPLSKSHQKASRHDQTNRQRKPSEQNSPMPVKGSTIKSLVLSRSALVQKSLLKRLAQRSSSLKRAMAPKIKAGKQKIMEIITKVKSYVVTHYPEVKEVMETAWQEYAPKFKKLADKAKSYIFEESPVYSAFISIGAGAVLFALFSAIFLSPSIWVIILLAGLLQIIVGMRLKSASNQHL